MLNVHIHIYIYTVNICIHIIINHNYALLPSRPKLIWEVPIFQIYGGRVIINQKPSTKYPHKQHLVNLSRTSGRALS